LRNSGIKIDEAASVGGLFLSVGLFPRIEAMMACRAL